MGVHIGFFRIGVKMQSTRSMDWMELPASVWTIEAYCQQQPVFNFAGLAYTQSWLPNPFIVFKEVGR
jgi:hypothetical protein